MDLSRTTLEFCDQLIDGVTLAANADGFEEWAAKIATARREVTDALLEIGGTPLATQRANGKVTT